MPILREQLDPRQPLYRLAQQRLKTIARCQVRELPEGTHGENSAPLRIGNGVKGPLNGRQLDVRVYRRTLEIAEIEALAAKAP